MKICLPVFTAFLLATVSAWACDDHVGECEIEDWRLSNLLGDTAVLEGVATCDEGKAIIRLYDGAEEDRKFIGTDTAYIEGHAFKTLMLGIGKLKSPSIKYSIKPNG